ncbi:hypothetical protein [Salmon gill poxvirus]
MGMYIDSMFEGKEFNQGTFINCTLIKCKLSNAHIEKSKVKRCRLTNCVIVKSAIINFKVDDSEYVSLTDNNVINKSSIETCNVTFTVFKHCTIHTGSRLLSCHMYACDTSDSTMVNSYFSDKTLINDCKINNGHLTRCDLKHVMSDNCKYYSCVIDDSFLNKSSMNKCELTRTYLNKSS